jgi:hypothetical protein
MESAHAEGRRIVYASLISAPVNLSELMKKVPLIYWALLPILAALLACEKPPFYPLNYGDSLL